MYNKTIKDSLNLPSRASHNNMDKLMGVQIAKNIVQSTYLRNYKLWEREFDEDEEIGIYKKEQRIYIDE